MIVKKVLSFIPGFFEQQAWAQQKLVCGIDEAGRGCLAGPLVVGTAILPINTHHKLLKDSKVLSEKQRNQAFEWIMQHCMTSYALCDHETIDRINIYQATLQTMQKAFFQLAAQHSILDKLNGVVVDAMPLKLPYPAYTHLPINHFNYGESISPSIAAASIVAKVTRDRLMETFDKTIPSFEFAKHKGYGTAVHRNHLINSFASLIHRNTFITNFSSGPHEPESKQQTLF